jgi:hypothetical protein
MTVGETPRPAASEPTAEEPETRDFSAAVYGSLLVTTLVAVQWQGDPAPGRIALTLLTSVAVFWLAHAWAEIVDHRVHGPISLRTAVGIASGESPIITAAIVPAIILGLPTLLPIEVDVAIGLALLASLAQLFLWGLTVGRAAHGSWPLALGVAIIDLALGILVVVLKVVVIH